MNKLQNKKESTISKINVKSNNKYAFQNTNRTETKFEKMVRKRNENVIKMQNRADNIYGNDEEYRKKYPDSFKNKKHNYFETIRDENKSGSIKNNIPDISNPEKLLFKNGMMGDGLWENNGNANSNKINYSWDKNGKIIYDEPQEPLPFVEKQKRNLLALGVNIYDWLNSDNEYYYKQRVNTLLGLATIPIGGGAAITANIAKPLVPIVGKKIATNIASGVAGGLAGGAVEGFGRGVIEGENPLKTMTQDALLSGAVGGLGGYALGRIAKGVDRSKALKTGDATNYVDDYLSGIDNPNKTDLRDKRAFLNGGELSEQLPPFWFDLIDGEDFNYEKVMKLADDLKNGKRNPLRNKINSVKIDNISPRQKEYIFNEIASSISDDEKAKGIVTRRLHNYDEKKDYLYTVIYDKNGQYQISRSIKIDDDIYD